MAQSTNTVDSPRPPVVSLFSGCGGLDHGFLVEGFDIVAAYDNDPAAVSTYNYNLEHSAHLLDISRPVFTHVLESIPSCDVLLGGFPCQGFSKAGPKQVSDKRNTLYRAMIVALETLRPKLFIAENVDGLAQNYNGKVLDDIVADCSNVGYRVEWKIVDAAWFGLPQHRRRIVIVGVRDDLPEPFLWPQATHRWITRNGERSIHQLYPNWANTLLEPNALGTALSNINGDDSDHNTAVIPDQKTRDILENIPEGSKLCNVRHDASNVRTWNLPKAFGSVTEHERNILETVARNRRHKKYGSIPNGNPLPLHVIHDQYDDTVTEDEMDNLVDRNFLKRIDNKWDIKGAMFASGLYKRPYLSQPSPTVLTVFGNPRYFAHPSQPRPFTVREVARLQSFPDDYRFLSSNITLEDAYRLIGNAVPPLLSQKLAQAATLTLRKNQVAPKRLETTEEGVNVAPTPCLVA